MLLVWHPEDGTRCFSPAPSSPPFPRRSLEDSRTQRASATCRMWDRPGWGNCKVPGKISATSDTNTQILLEDVEETYRLRSYCTYPAYPSRSSPGPCGTRSTGRGMFYFTLEEVCVCMCVWVKRWECVCVLYEPCCVAAAAVWGHLWVSPPAKTDVSVLSPPVLSCLPHSQASGRQEEEQINAKKLQNYIHSVWWFNAG